MSDVLGVFKVEELLPGCRKEGCGYRCFRAVKVDLESEKPYLNDGDSIEYLEKGRSMINW